MKRLIIPAFVLAAIVGCKKQDLSPSTAEAPSAHFKEGHGVAIPASMQKSLGVEVADVVEQKIHPHVSISLHLPPGTESNRAEGWLTDAQAKLLRPGMSVRVTAPGPKEIDGTIGSVEKVSFPIDGYQLSVRLGQSLPAGTSMAAKVDLPAVEGAIAVPGSAVVNTAEGAFVYTVNDDYFARTAVKVGAKSDEVVEILDGLYAGDQIVVSQVQPLWMTELHALRAGHACSEGH